jgi:hypothetical protein
MAITARLYGPLLAHLAAKRIDWLGDAIHLTLHTATYVPDQDLHDFVNDLTNELPTGGGYTAGGIALATKTAAYDAATNTLVLDAADISIPNSTLTWRVAVLSDRTPTLAADQPLIAYFLSDVDIVSSGGTTTITFAADGIARISAA